MREETAKLYNVYVMVLCNVLVLSMLDVAFQIECSDFTSFFYFRKLGELSVRQPFAVSFVADLFLMSVDYILRIESVRLWMNEWRAICRELRIAVLSRSLRHSSALKLYALWPWEMISRDELSWFPPFRKILYTSASPEENWNTQTDRVSLFSIFGFSRDLFVCWFCEKYFFSPVIRYFADGSMLYI